MGSQEDFCAICADPLEWTAFGPCGHREACSRCVAQVRFLLKDKRCVICQQEEPQLFFTRYMGDYTTTVPPDAFSKLKERARRGELYELPEVNGFFDDQGHFSIIRDLCSYTHPVLGGQKLPTLAALKKKIKDETKLSFCDLCLAGRKVFVCEQQLYNKAELTRHNQHGDDSGPLKESGFKGHPLCRFCKRRFYDGNELYKHMETQHENCFLCRRMHPGEYVYYKDYAELEGHFNKEHFPCPHAVCQEKKFVVFSSEADLKIHIAKEHGEELRMSRSQKREAMVIPVPFQYSSYREAQQSLAPEVPPVYHRPGVVIGGGSQVSSQVARGRGRGGAGRGLPHSRSEPQLRSDLQMALENSLVSSARAAAVDSDDDVNEGPNSGLGTVTFTAEDFPMAGATSTSAGSTRLAIGRWGPSFGGSASGPRTSEQDFPALPGVSKSARRRMKEKAKVAASLAEQMRNGLKPPTVLHRARPGRGNGPGGGGHPPGRSRSEGNFLCLEDPEGFCEDPDNSDVEEEEAEAAGPSSSTEAGLSEGMAYSPVQVRSPGPSTLPQSLPLDDFPSLGVSSAPTPPPSATWMGKKGAGSSAGGTQRVRFDSKKPPVGLTEEVLSREYTIEYPSLGDRGATNVGGPLPSGGAAAATTSSTSGVSESLREANKELSIRIKQQLKDDEASFGTFKAHNKSFMQGVMSVDEYHSHLVQLGLVALVPDLAALCPVPDLRQSLLEAHRRYLTSEEAQDPFLVKGTWVPPEAGLAAVDQAETRSSWSCQRCTLLNAPFAKLCEACGHKRPTNRHLQSTPSSSSASAGRPSKGKQPAAPELESAWQPTPSRVVASARPVLRETESRGESSTTEARKVPMANNPSGEEFPALLTGTAGTMEDSTKKKKPEKKTIKDFLQTGSVHPQNVWTQNRKKAAVAPAPAGQSVPVVQPRGQWKQNGGEKIAKKFNAYNEAMRR